MAPAEAQKVKLYIIRIIIRIFITATAAAIIIIHYTIQKPTSSQIWIFLFFIYPLGE